MENNDATDLPTRHRPNQLHGTRNPACSGQHPTHSPSLFHPTHTSQPSMWDCSCSRASSFSICRLVSLILEHTVFMACKALCTAGWSGCFPGVLLASSWGRGKVSEGETSIQRDPRLHVHTGKGWQTAAHHRESPRGQLEEGKGSRIKASQKGFKEAGGTAGQVLATVSGPPLITHHSDATQPGNAWAPGLGQQQDSPLGAHGQQ